MTHYFQHPKKINGTLNTSIGEIKFTTDKFSRSGIASIEHNEQNLPVIEALNKAKVQDIGEPTAAQKQINAEAISSSTPSTTFKHPSKLNVKLNTSAGEIPFVNGLATVSGKQADVLIGLKYQIVNSTEGEETKKDPSKQDENKTIDTKKENEEPKKSIVPTLEAYVGAGYKAEEYEKAFPGLSAGDEYTEELLAENKKKADEKQKPGLTPKQLKKLAENNGIETKDKTDAEITSALKDKGLLQ